MASGGGTSPSGSKEMPGLHLHTEKEHDQLQPDVPVDGVNYDPIPAISVQPGDVKENEEVVVIESKGAPLTLLNLPVDVLRLIVNEITEGSDLITLAMVHSALFELAVSKLYTWFDIYWTPISPGNDSKAVDALSYGLATLAHPNKFAQSVRLSRGVRPGQLGLARQLADHDYAKYVRTFYISYGPREVTSEYSIDGESGKLLGTLVSLAVSKMVNLEKFTWDMDSGVLSDVFMALSSLQDDEGRSKLQRVWIRLHDKSTLDTSDSSSSSSPTIGLPPPPPPAAPWPAEQIHSKLATPIGNYIYTGADTTVPEPRKYADISVEYPTFSILPALKSLTVLNIDDISYLDEISFLIERSASQLMELRVGLSAKSVHHDFALPWDGPDLQQVDHEASWPGENRISNFRLGGVLGVLVGRVYDIRKKSKEQDGENSPPKKDTNPPSTIEISGQPKETHEAAQSDTAGSSETLDPSLGRKRLDGKLKLQTLALEKVGISPNVVMRAIDWSNMTSLTILDCTFHEVLWRTLKRQFQPTRPGHGSSREASPQYRLSLKHFHVEPVTPAFVAFVRETIPPNTIETLFLQDQQQTGKPFVAIDQIFKSIVKRHHGSIKKLLIHILEDRGFRGRWKNWAIKDEFLTYITSGKIRSLTELGIMMNFRDWHTFIRHLPQLANLRTLYIPHMARFHMGRTRELALQIVDIVSLRREIQLVYIGLFKSCYEIYEGDPEQEGDNIARVDDDNITDSDGGGDDEAEAGNNHFSDSSIDSDDEPVDDLFDDGQSQTGILEESGGRRRTLPPLRLRAITFYDDKVDLFRARKAKL